MQAAERGEACFYAAIAVSGWRLLTGGAKEFYEAGSTAAVGAHRVRPSVANGAVRTVCG